MEEIYTKGQNQNANIIENKRIATPKNIHGKRINLLEERKAFLLFQRESPHVHFKPVPFKFVFMFARIKPNQCPLLLMNRIDCFCSMKFCNFEVSCMFFDIK